MMLNLIHSVEEINRFNEICQESISATSMRKPALLVCMSVRNKYSDQDNEGLVSETKVNTFFNQKLYTHDLLDIITKYEVKEGVYTFKGKNGERIPMNTNASVVYMYINPRDQIHALHLQYTSVMNNLLTNQPVPDRISSNFLHMFVHKSNPQHKRFIDVDIDSKDLQYTRLFLGFNKGITDYIAFSIETRNGFHVCCYKDKFPSNLYLDVINCKEFDYIEKNRIGKDVKKKYVEIRSNVCMPVPGTFQAGFPVRFVDILELVKTE